MNLQRSQTAEMFFSIFVVHQTFQSYVVSYSSYRVSRSVNRLFETILTDVLLHLEDLSVYQMVTFNQVTRVLVGLSL